MVNNAIERCTLCRGTAAAENVLWDCLPVPYFGKLDPLRVRVVAVSLNPSSLEFYDANASAKPVAVRLPMLADFNVRDRELLLPGSLQSIAQVRANYFSNAPHAWFTPMQIMLQAMDRGWSYYDGTAAQVDVIACATTPAFGEISPAAKEVMVRNCRPHLQHTVSHFRNGTVIIINGRSAFEAFGAAVKLTPNEFSARLPSSKVTIFTGTAQLSEKQFRYFGWSTYLHRSSVREAGTIVDYWSRLPPELKR
jgi:hypothetical protein